MATESLISREERTVARPLTLSIILPAKNEAEGLRRTLERLRKAYPGQEIIVVDDGSEDDTASVAREQGARVISHPYSRGNGAAIKTGARHAGGDVLVFMDADGQHDPDDISRLLARMDDGFDMVVGARRTGSHASAGRLMANGLYNVLASFMTGTTIEDLTSGFRCVKATLFRDFLYLLPNGFSYPTTITMAFFRAGYSVAYVPIDAGAREGRSHIRPVRDGLRFLLIIFKVGTLYSPLKIYVPLSMAFFGVGLAYYVYTYISYHRLTNMTVLLFIVSILVFMMGLLSEQITQLIYKGTSADKGQD